MTLVERDGIGGACVLTDCVPSKTLIATAEVRTSVSGADALGLSLHRRPPVDASPDQRAHQGARGRAVRPTSGRGCCARASRSSPAAAGCSGRATSACSATGSAEEEQLDADVVLLAFGATPRVIPGSEPDGERILDWRQLYDLTELPEHLIVVGSGVTGAEFASAYRALGSEVTLVSSRDRVLPGEDADAAAVLEDVFRRRGIEVLNRSRAASIQRTATSVVVELTDGRSVSGSHALMAVGSVPDTAGIGLEEAGVRLGSRGHIEVDKVSRTAASRGLRGR